MEAIEQTVVLKEREVGGSVQHVGPTAATEELPEQPAAEQAEPNGPCPRCMPWPFLVPGS